VLKAGGEEREEGAVRENGEIAEKKTRGIWVDQWLSVEHE